MRPSPPPHSWRVLVTILAGRGRHAFEQPVASGAGTRPVDHQDPGPAVRYRGVGVASHGRIAGLLKLIETTALGFEHRCLAGAVGAACAPG